MLHIDKVKVQWISDACGNTNCHFNDGSKSLKESYVGRVFHRDGHWWSRVKDSAKEDGPWSTFGAAKRVVEDSVNGESLEDI